MSSGKSSPLRRWLVLTVLLVVATALYIIPYGVPNGESESESVRLVLPSVTDGQEKARQPQLNANAILLLGTSLSIQKEWASQIELELSKCSDHPVKVIRMARPGASSKWGLSAYQAYLESADYLWPRVIVIEFSINDASLFQGMRLSDSYVTTKAIVSKARDQDSTVFLATMNPSYGRNFLERPGQAKYRAIYRDLAHQTGIGLIDTTGVWASLTREERELYIPDGLHPSMLGMKRITLPAFVEALSPIFCSSKKALQ